MPYLFAFQDSLCRPPLLSPIFFLAAILLIFSSPAAAQPVKPDGSVRLAQPQTDTAGRGPSRLEQRLVQEGLIDVCRLDPTIVVELKYSTANNFMGVDVYQGLAQAYLRPEAAKKLARASEILRERHPNLRILVGDAARPRLVQQEMWKLVVNTPRQPYVANPKTGSMHNHGAAVDVTLFDVDTGERLDMGTPLDHFGSLAQPLLEDKHLREGKLSARQIENRLILRKAMVDAGWHPLAIEWWHFDAFPKEHVRLNYPIIE